MTAMTSLPPVIIFVIGALLLLVLPRQVRSFAYLVFPALAFILLLQFEPGTSLTVNFLNYELMPCRVDRLSLAFGYIFTIMAFIGGFYAFHVRDRLQQVATLLYAGGGLGVVFAGDLLTLIIFWELMAVASVCLIWARRTERSNKAGMRYLMVHLFGGGVLLAGILWYITDTGSIMFNLFEGGAASYLILIGFCINAAVPPLHAWLPDAYPEGTVTGSVFLSAFTTKTAVYVLARGFAGFDILIWAGTIMALYGVVFAVLENDIRRLLAYHIISQVGYMVAAVGIGSEMSLNGATAHAFAHILYKSLLFMGAGVVLYTTGRSKLSELGGLARHMKVVFLLYMIGALSISGFPLFSGFVSKSMVISAAEHGHLPLIALLLNLASVGTFLHTGLKLPYFTWLGPDRGLKPTVPTPWGMYAGMAMAALLCFGIGVFPGVFYKIMPYAVDYQPYTASHVTEALMMLLFTGLGFWWLIGKLGGEATVTMDTDWFYRRPARLAYTCFVASVARIFTAVEIVVFSLARGIVGLAANPTGNLLRGGRSLAHLFGGSERGTGEAGDYNPDRYQLSAGVMVLVVLAVFVVLLAWGILK